MASDKVQVAVRVRPMNRRELDLGTKCVVDMQGNQIILFHPKDIPHDEGGGSGGKDRGGGGGRKAPKTFAFDHCFWTIDKNDPRFAELLNIMFIIAACSSVYKVQMELAIS